MLEPHCLLATLHSTLCKSAPTSRDKWESKSIGPVAGHIEERAQIRFK